MPLNTIDQSNRAPARRKSRKSAATVFENLESRQLMSANLHMIEAYWGDASGNKLNTVAVGSQPHLWVNYNVEGVPAGSVYQIRATVNGNTHTTITNAGAGQGNQNLKAMVGRHMVPGGWFQRQVVLDATGAIAETDELDNSHTTSDQGVAFGSKFTFPVAGTPWVDWSVGNYVDVDLASGDNHKFDWTGGTFTYDGHNGWDIGPGNWRAADDGITIRAAAAGTVVAVHDGEYDRNYTWDGQPSNYVVLDHGGGWRSIYHHFRRDTITVTQGQQVAAGQSLGLMGSSGNSTFAHLHWEVRYNNLVVEPMVAESLYMKNPIGYSANHPTILDAGVTSYALNMDELIEGPTQADQFLTAGGSRTVRSWASFGGVENGDTIGVQWFRPNGALYSSGSWQSGQIQGGYQTAQLTLPSPATAGTWQVAWTINGVEKARKNFIVSSVARPQVKITRGGNYVVDNRSTPWDLGSIQHGQATLPTMTFQVWNNGTAALNTSSLSVPAGFSIVEGLSASIPAGSFDNFTVRLDGATVGKKFGWVSFDTNDPDFHETFMRFRVEGEVQPISPLSGTSGDDEIYIKRSGSNARIWVNRATHLSPSYELPVSATGLLELNTMEGNDRVTVDVSGGYPLQNGLKYDGGAGIDRLRVIGSAGNNTFSVTGTQVNWSLAPGMQYQGVETVEIVGGDGSDNLYLNGAGDLDNLAHDVVFDGGAGADSVTVQDRNDTGNHAYLLTDLFFDRAGTFGALYYANVETLNINAAHDDNIFRIRGVAAGTTANIRGGDGNDTFIVGESLNHTNRVFGTVSISGEGGTDSVEYRDTANVPANTPDSYTITGSSITRTGSGLVSFDTVESLRVLASGVRNNIGVNSANADLAIAVNGGSGDDFITVAESTIPVVIEPSSGSDTLNVNTDGSGSAGVVFNQTQTIAALIIGNGGMAQVAPGGNTVLKLQGLGVTPGGKLDLADNGMIMEYTGSSPLASVRQMLQAGFNGGAWDGMRLTSSTAAADPTQRTALGYAEASDVIGPSGGTFMGQPVDGTAVLVRYTRYGDANLDGQVNLADFNRLAANFGGTTGGWSRGDFNFDDLVNLADFNALAGNFGASV